MAGDPPRIGDHPTGTGVWDVDSIYKIPMMLHNQMLDEIVCHKLGILALAIVMDATVIRGLLVPAFMRKAPPIEPGMPR